MSAWKTILIGSVLCACLVGLGHCLACPFCSATSQTLSEEIAAADVAVIARLIKLPPEADPNSEKAGLDLDNLGGRFGSGANSGMAEFEVIETIRSKEGSGDGAAPGSTIKVVYFGGNEQKNQFLISGIAGKQIDWTTPLPLTERGIEYVKALGTLPEKGPERLSFFLRYLEDEDPLLGQDAYDEFARAPYEVVIALSDRMDRPQLLDWIEDSRVGPTRRRLYLTMLGICGQPSDVEILESLINYDYQQMKPGVAAMLAVMGQAGPVVGVPVINEMIKADVRRKQQCLDALIAAYLKLKGPTGLPLIEQRFLTNPAAEYTHVYAAVMALRFHGEETDALPKARLLESMRLLLDNADIADQVIPDLARWDDWSILDRLVTMFKESTDDAWVRQPVISYLLAASEQPAEVGQRGNAALAELEQLDPQAVKRARSYMAFGLLARAGAKKKTPAPVDKPAADGLGAGTGKAGTGELTTPEAATPEAATAEAGNQPSAGTLVGTNAGTNTGVTAAEGEAAQSGAGSTAAVSGQSKAGQPEVGQPEEGQSEERQSASLVDAPQPDALPTPGPSRMLIIGGPLIAGLFLFGVFALLLRGTDVRSSSNDS